MIDSNIVEYKIVGDTNVPLLRCFPFISKVKGGDIITTGQYMNYQTFSNLQFWPLLKNSFQKLHIDLRDTSGEKIPLVSVGITWFILRTAIPFLRKYVVPAAKRIGGDMLEIAAPEIGENISGRKSFKKAAKSVGKQTLQKQLGIGNKQSRIIPTKSTKQSSRSRRDI